MADLQTLFHNPESLNDSDLSKVRSKIRRQSLTPWVFTSLFGGAAYMKYKCPMYISAFTIAGFALGAKLSYMASPMPTGYC